MTTTTARSVPTVGGPRGPSFLGSLKILRKVMYNPVGMVDDYRGEYGDIFTVPMPFGLAVPFTFITTREAYSTVLGLDPEVGRNGPVVDRVPALAKWSPRSDYSDAHLQTLMLAGRRFIRSRVRERSGDAVIEGIRALVRRHVGGWPGPVDLGVEFVHMVHEASCRLLLGDDLWDALGTDALKLVRTVVNAVDTARGAIALSPAAAVLPEYRAAKELGRRLVAIAKDPASDQLSFVRGLRTIENDGAPFVPEDVAWMMFFSLWNASLYTGSYGTWAFLDLLDHPDVLEAVRSPSAERDDVVVGGILETMRRNPVSWQVRSLARSVTVKCGEHDYEVPPPNFLVVFSHGLNRDPSLYPEPEAWKPRRYLDGAPAPLLFGSGPFSCVAQHWAKLLLATIIIEVIERWDVKLLGPLPKRVSRVHLLYPSEPVLATLKPRPAPAA